MAAPAARQSDAITPSRFLHGAGRLAWRFPGLLRQLGNLETRMLADRIEPIAIRRPIYITGLARAGTTILLELLARHPDTATHRYRDFPFVQTPVWWNWFLDRAMRSHGEPVERFHADRIRVTPQSPEAMEEILWMAFFPDCHAPDRCQVLGGDARHAVFDRFYQDHIRKLLHVRRGRRYLAKNNYNLTRLAYLQALFPDARFVVLFRSPAAHVASLRRQHGRLCEHEQADPRVLDYMRHAGHFEFGLDRRLIHTGDDARARSIAELWDRGDEVRGWARYWAMLHDFAAGSAAADPALRAATLFVSYEAICATPAVVLRRIYAHGELAVDASTLEQQSSQLSAPAYYTPDFTRVELDVIEQETAPAHARLLALT